MVAAISSATRTSSAATTSAPMTVAICPPADPHSGPPGWASTDLRAEASYRRKAGQPKNTNAALAVRDVLGGPPVRTAQQPPVRRADSRTPPSGGRWHRKLRQSQLSQRTEHAGADDACGRSAPRCQSPPPPPPPLGRWAPSPLNAEGGGGPPARTGGRAPAQLALHPSKDDEDP
jgi:hypothetical protein